MADYASDDECVGSQVAKQDDKAHQGDAISDAWIGVRLLAEGQGQDAPVGHWPSSSAAMTRSWARISSIASQRTKGVPISGGAVSGTT